VATVIETFEIMLDSRTLVTELKKIELVEALEGAEQRLWEASHVIDQGGTTVALACMYQEHYANFRVRQLSNIA